jgi:acetyl/propionyl-CoA carboxylase alpha subunit
VREADRGVEIGPAPAAESYLRIEAVVDAARRTGVDAVHPGYGFLAENAAFAAACEESGLIFVGPPPDVIERMGSKIAARDLMERAGVPVVGGRTPADQSDDGVVAAARAVGVPVLVKASAGGGGKGMRTVHRAGDLAAAIAAARREAIAAFGDGTLYVERLIERPRHVELQILADSYGEVVHLFERDCSAQRRHQKIVEETPSPALSSALRERMGAAAITAARASAYRNAGTVEFLVEGEGNAASFYFLEMNTRLQVEHTITEEVAGRDLVHAQLAIAAGGRLPWTQEQLVSRGHAIECRVYAEDPRNEFLPQAGRLLAYREPQGPGIRVDAGVESGDEIPVHYDPLIAKLVCRAETREAAIARASGAVGRFVVLGVRSNLPFLARLLRHPRFQAGKIDTTFVDGALAELATPPPIETVVDAVAAAAWSQLQARSVGGPSPDRAAPNGTAADDPWTSLQGWRG